MNCPKCDGKTHVLETRRFSNEALRRRRECRACKHRFTTEERVIVIAPVDRKAVAERVMEMKQEALRKQAEARRQIENRELARSLGLSPDELNEDF